MRIPESTERERPDIGTLYAEEGQRLWRAVFAFCHDREVANDAVAESFAQCVRRGDDIRDPRAWVWRVAFRIAAGQLKERRKVSYEMREVAYEMPEDPGRLLDALRSLPPRQRAALVLRHYAGYPTDEIARILGSSRATVRVHLSRGRKRLYELLGDDDA